MEIWLDGSFATRKPEPEDVDVMLFVKFSAIRQLSPNRQRHLEALIANREESRRRFNCDVYFADKNDSGAREYWQQAFGLTPDRLRTKGIFKIHLHAAASNRPD